MSSTVRVFRTPEKIIMGPGAVETVGDEARRLKGSLAMIVSDKGIVSSGITDQVRDFLEKNGIKTEVYDKIELEPSTENLQMCLNRVKEGGFDIVIGVGGGSSIDIAKTTAVLVANEGEISKFFGIDLIPKPGLPTIIIPTTAGTGAEVTLNAIFAIPAERLKKGMVSPYLLPRVSIVDPLLTLSCPPKVTAATGMDALVHAIESYTSLMATSLTEPIALKAIELISGNLIEAYRNGRNVEARIGMCEGSLLAGISLANAGVGAVHAMAYPLGGIYGIAHGTANSLMFSYVMDFNLKGSPKKFSEIAKAMGKRIEGLSPEDSARLSVEAVRELARALEIPQRLRDIGIPKEGIAAMAEGTMKGTRLLNNNPRAMTLEDAIAIYEKAY